ncbi:MAG: zinc-ribbon domain-containing protein, partial [Pseudomonadota bacterium]
MKLTCPNCAAQYEVPDEVIPETGRDVQCSACGDTWFQVHPNHPEYKPSFDPEAPEEEVEDDSFGNAWEQTPDPSADADADAEPDHQPEHEDAPAPEYEAQAATELVDDEDRENPTPVAARRDLPEDVASVLREEAEIETRAREADMAGGFDGQQDPGFGETQEIERRSREAKARMSRLRGFDEAPEEPVSDLVQRPDPEAPQSLEPEIDLGT